MPTISKEDIYYIQNNPEKVWKYLKSLEGGEGGSSPHNHAISDITNLQATLDGKLTASKAATQEASSASDVSELVSDFNDLLSKLKTAGIML